MTNAHGEWIWFELLTSDPDAAAAFYGDVAGWTAAGSGMPGMDYRLFVAPDGVQVGGLMKMPAGMGDGPVWLGYIGVDDVDAAAEAIVAAGGAIHMPPTTMPGVGRMAMLTDPQGVAFYVMRGESSEASRAFAVPPGSEGHVVWSELSAPDPDQALDFYRSTFGWRQEGGMPMGELGEYRFLWAGQIGIGAVMGVMPQGSKGWLFYIHVPDIDAAAERIRAGGGTIAQEPIEIPEGDYALVAKDPQGAGFGLVGPRKQ